MAQRVKNSPAMWEVQFRSLGQEDPLEKGMATHSSILACRTPWTEEPDGLWTEEPMESPCHEPMDRALVGYVQRSPWGRKVSDMTEQLTL